MTIEQLVEHSKRLANAVLNAGSSRDGAAVHAQYAQACEFLRRFGGSHNSFLDTITRVLGKYSDEYVAKITAQTLLSFASYVQSGLADEISPERRAQLDIVSDLLEQANLLLETPKVHPVAPAVIIGATLEEFLRTWIETAGISLGQRKPGIDSYTSLLREAGLVTKQDAKDITAWAGIRNHAAHGEWAQVESREKVALMLQGVNLFMRKYEGGKGA